MVGAISVPFLTLNDVGDRLDCFLLVAEAGDEQELQRLMMIERWPLHSGRQHSIRSVS